MDFTVWFKKIAAQLQLGSLLSPAARVSGGFLHTMYRLNTEQKSYAVKLLNPTILKRPGAVHNYTQADALETLLEQQAVPMVPALVFNGKKMQNLDEQFFYVYEWYDGSALHHSEITVAHCRKISKALSCIHHTEMRRQRCEKDPLVIDWQSYIATAKNQSAPFYSLLRTNEALLCESLRRANAAAVKLPDVISICHNDMDSKNVLWLGSDFKIIDWECLSFASPYLELLETALCWSGYEESDIDFERLHTFINCYFEGRSKPALDWSVLYDSNCGRLAWLAYNVRRALQIECGTDEEQAIGREQAKQTMAHILYAHKVRDAVLDCLESL